jgi:cytochrome c556
VYVGELDGRPLAFGARLLARWAGVLPTLFPAGTNVPPSRARPEVWTDQVTFGSRARDYAEAAARLAEVARTGDRQAFAAQWNVVRDTCTACHDRFRSETQP